MYTGSDLVGQAMSGNPRNDPETAMAKEKKLIPVIYFLFADL